VVFSDPLEETDKLLEEFILTNIEKRNSSVIPTALPTVKDQNNDQTATKKLKITEK
jgi:hypothetical protein